MSILTSVLRFLSRHPAVRVGKAKARLWRDFWYLIRGRLIVPDGATPMPATTGVWFLPAAISVATVSEITAVELLVPWKELRIILAIASVYSLMILWAMLGRQKTYPPLSRQRLPGSPAWWAGPGRIAVVDDPGLCPRSTLRNRPGNS